MKSAVPSVFLSCLSFAALTAFPVQAAPNTWSNGTSTSIWDASASANWVSPATWTNGDDAIFDAAGAGIVTIAGGVTANSLTFNAAGYTIGGAALNLTGPTITTAAATDTFITSTLTGYAGLTKEGAGWLRLSGANIYSGTTTVTGGALFAYRASGPAIPGNLTLGNGTSPVFFISSASNQLAPGAIVTFANAGLDTKFQLRGNNQTVGGLSSTGITNLAIIQNDEIGTPGYTSAAANATLTIDNSTEQIFHGIIRNQSGVLSLIKEGTGHQELRNSTQAVGIAHTGSTTINNGRLTLNLNGANNGFASAVTVNAAGTLGLNGTFSMGQVISGTGQVYKSGLGTVTLSGTTANTYTGLTTVAGGAPDGLGALVLAKTAGTNAVGGNITIGDGATNSVLRLGANNQIPDTSVITFNSGTIGGTSAKFELNNFSETVAGISSPGGASLIQAYEGTGGTGTGTLTVNNSTNQTFDGILRNGGSGVLALTKTGNGTLTILNTTTAGATSYSGLTTASAGLLQFGNSTATRKSIGSGALHIDAAGQVLLHFANGQTHANTITGSGKLDFRNNSSPTSLGGNEHIITGTNDGFSGAITITDGRLRVQDALSRLGNASATNTITTLGNGQLMYNGAGTYNYNVSIQGLGYYETGTGDRFGALRLEVGAVQAGSVTLLANSGIGSHQSGGTISGVISDGGNGYSLTKLGNSTLTLTNTNTYSGQTTVQAGTLALTGTGSIASSSGIRIADGANLNVSGTASTWTLGSGKTLGGNGTITGNFNVAGTLAPGNSAGALTTTGNVVLNSGSLWNIELGGTAPAAYDRLLGNGTNTLTAAGTLVFTLIDGFVPAPGDSFTIAGNFQSITGSGATFDFTAAPAGAGNSWDTSAFATNGRVTLVPETSSALLSGLASLALLRRRRQTGPLAK